MQKKIELIHGRLYAPLKVGEKAVIICPVEILFTEPVTEICCERGAQIVFETWHRRYCLFLKRATEQVLQPILHFAA